MMPFVDCIAAIPRHILLCAAALLCTAAVGGPQVLVGTIKRINRTEYTLLIQFFDAASGEPVANYFTGLRMGANYSWPRGVTWLMKNRILAKSGGRGSSHQVPISRF